MVIKKIIKAVAKKALKPKKKGGKARLPPRPKSAKMKKAQVSLVDRKRAAAMTHVKKLEKQGHFKAANKARAWIERGDAFRRGGSGTKKEFSAWAKKAKTLGPSRERLQPKQDKEILPRGVTLRSLANREEYWRKAYAEKGKKVVLGRRRPSPPPYEEHRLGWNPYNQGRWVKDPRPDSIRRSFGKRTGTRPSFSTFTGDERFGNFSWGKKPVRKGPRTVAGLDRDDWFIAGLAGAGPAIGAAYWENKEKINKLPGNAIDVIRDRRDAILRRLGLI